MTLKRNILSFIFLFSLTCSAQDKSIGFGIANDYSYFFDENPPTSTHGKLWLPRTVYLSAHVRKKTRLYTSFSHYFMSYYEYFDQASPIPFQPYRRLFISSDVVLNRTIFKYKHIDINVGVGAAGRMGNETQHVSYVYFSDGETIRSSNLIYRNMNGIGFSLQSSINYRIRSFNFSLRSKYNRIYEAKEVIPQMPAILLERNPHMISFHFSIGYIFLKW